MLYLVLPKKTTTGRTIPFSEKSRTTSGCFSLFAAEIQAVFSFGCEPISFSSGDIEYFEAGVDKTAIACMESEVPGVTLTRCACKNVSDEGGSIHIAS